MSRVEKINSALRESIRVKEAIAGNEILTLRIEQAAFLFIEAFREGRKVLFCGNGGSAADAQHLAAELSGRFRLERRPLHAVALSVNSSAVTAIGNDYGFDKIFARQVEGAGKEGDVLLVLSTSGNSENILRAVETALSKGMHVIALTGESGGRLASMDLLLINVPSSDTARIQEAHITIGHIICELCETALFR